MAAIQGFVAEEAFVERFEERNLDWFHTGMRLALIRSIALPLLVLSGGVAMFALIAVGGPMVLGGSLTVGELAAFTALLTVFLPPLRSMGWMMSVIQRGRAALERIFELIDAPIERPEGAVGVVLESGHGPVIELCDLHFAYPDEADREVLTGLTATIPAGGVPVQSATRTYMAIAAISTFRSKARLNAATGSPVDSRPGIANRPSVMRGW